MRRPRIHLAATPGGHLDLLEALRPAFEDYDRTWVTAPGGSADALRAAGERVRTLPRFHGVPPAFPLHAVRAAALVARERPHLVVTAGSGSVAPFCAMARAAGACVVFTETMARMDDPSTTGRRLHRLAHRTLVQWPEMRAHYPGAIVVRPALLEERGGSGPGDGHGTLVAVGTHVDPFDRLLRIADDAVGAGLLPQPAVAQSGPATYRPRHLQAVPWMAPDELDAAIVRARHVVTHAGSGLIARCLRRGIRPLVLPRLAARGEHVDDHQLQLSRRLAEAGCIVPLDDAVTPDAVAASEQPPPPHEPNGLPGMADVLADVLSKLSRGRARRRP